jgi:hypothetical protein
MKEKRKEKKRKKEKKSAHVPEKHLQKTVKDVYIFFPRIL